MIRHLHLDHTSVFMSRTRCLLQLCLVAIGMLCLASGTTCMAQFNGPGISASSEVNRTITLTTDPAVLYPPQPELRLGPGDMLGIHIYGSAEYAPQAQVSLDGSIQLPLIGNVAVQGLTIHQTEHLIAERLVSAGMYRDPQINLQLVESPNQIATLAGEIKAIVPLRGPRRLFDVITTGGGLPATASHIITIQRLGREEPIVVDLGTDPAHSQAANIPIFAGDTVLTARMGVIYMLGSFRNQGAVPLQQNTPLTLMQAAALSGGPTFDGKFNDLRLVRTFGLERKVVHVDIKRVMQGRDPDPVLQPDDIVFLPSSPMKAAIKSGGLGTVLGLASILIIATQN